MTNKQLPKLYGSNVWTLLPTRKYSVPGGPLSGCSGEAEVNKLADIERGGAQDGGSPGRRGGAG